MPGNKADRAHVGLPRQVERFTFSDIDPTWMEDNDLRPHVGTKWTAHVVAQLVCAGSTQSGFDSGKGLLGLRMCEDVEV